MSYERIQEVEKYLMKKKKKTPDDIRIARTHLLMVTSEMSKEELTNAKYYLQGQLFTSQMIGNHLNIMAILVSIFAIIISLIATSNNPQYIGFQIVILLFILLTFVLTVLVSKMHKKTMETSKLCDGYTIIINLLDEILDKR
ncbi:hypothetical protein [Paenibacillus sp. NPDC058177]|uniref:hypothetical protein n=1 Tax=Paenibacillus sp. NPDC058177 TaxID=3346369 RepID=UPI0036D7C8DB